MNEMVSMETLNMRYRQEKTTMDVTPSLERNFYSEVYGDIIEPMKNELKESIANGREVRDGLNSTLIHARDRCLEIKALRANKIAFETLTFARYKKGVGGKKDLDKSKLISDAKGNEVKLQEALLDAFNEYLFGSTE